MTKADEEKAARKSEETLKKASSEFKKGTLDKLKEHDESAPNGPDGAQRGQPLPDTAKVEATSEPVSKPQNTQK